MSYEKGPGWLCGQPIGPLDREKLVSSRVGFWWSRARRRYLRFTVSEVRPKAFSTTGQNRSEGGSGPSSGRGCYQGHVIRQGRWRGPHHGSAFRRAIGVEPPLVCHASSGPVYLGTPNTQGGRRGWCGLSIAGISWPLFRLCVLGNVMGVDPIVTMLHPFTFATGKFSIFRGFCFASLEQPRKGPI